MRKLIKKLFFTKKNKRQKTKELLSKYGLKIVKQKETALILCCFSVVFLKKKGKVNLTDEYGNILEAGIKDTEIDTYMKKYDDLAKKEGVSTKQYLEDLAKVAKRKTKQYWDNYTFKDMFEGKKPCFLAGTLIHTTAGLKPIEEIQKGDTVLCYNEIEKEIAQQQVSQTFENFTEKYAKIKTASGEILEVTGQHLFYQKTSGTWIKAHQLKGGMHLYNPKTDSLEKIISKEVINKEATTYNFEVLIHHNYLVGNTGVLAHNANRRPSYKDATKRGYAFYELALGRGTTEYIGKTTRENILIRASEHQDEGKRAIKKGIKPYYHWKASEQLVPFHLDPDHPFTFMNEFESAVWERYQIEKTTNDLKKINKDLKLHNRQMPLGRNVNSKTFAKYKDYWNKLDKNFNPCKYF